MSDKLAIHGSMHENILVISLVGALDGHTYSELDTYLHQHMQKQTNHFVIVLKDVTYIASAGVGLLITFMKQCSEAGGAFEVAEPSESVNEVMQILGLDALMTLHRSTERAIEAAQLHLS